MNRRTTSINQQTTIAITVQDDQIDLEQPIWVINWFNLKRSKLYTLYNVLVFPHLKKVGGHAHFKGYIRETGRKSGLRPANVVDCKVPDSQRFLEYGSE